MKKQRGRPGIKPFIKTLIYDQASKNKDTPRTALAVKLEQLIKRMGEVPPCREVMEKLISQARNHPPSPLEQPWNTATLDQHPIPPEALPAVLKVGKSRFEKGHTFTIREAKWVSRLSALQQDIKELSFIARRHASLEKACEFFEMPYDPTFLDMLLMGLPQAAEWASDKNSFSYYLAYVDSDNL